MNISRDGYAYFRAEPAARNEYDLPEGKRIPFEWNSIAVYKDKALKLNWKKNTIPAQDLSEKARIRITVALDVREEKIIEAYLPVSKEYIGYFDIRYAPVFQIFELEVTNEHVSGILNEGLELRLTKGKSPLWIFADAANSSVDHVFLPHIVFETDTNKTDMFINRMASLASIQQFGWMEGCVLDGLMDLYNAFGFEKVKNTIKNHINLYIDNSGNLVYENPRSEPSDNSIYGIECTLPFAAVAMMFPENPVLDLLLNFVFSEKKEDGSIVDGYEYTAEGSYTIAYPLAVFSGVFKRDDLAKFAIRQLELRMQHLVVGEDLYLRSNPKEKTFKNWARAYSWYMLGLIRTIIILGEANQMENLKQEFVRISKIAISKQHEDGLWSCFLGEEHTGRDTSGSAGIAAALAMGVKAGILGNEFLNNIKKVHERLKEYLTFDGLLTGAAQSNKAGESLQRSSYRVIYQVGMGLMAQLMAALKEVKQEI